MSSMEPYSSSLINRTKELEEINKVLSANPLSMTPILAFFGAFGIGKTSLLKGARERCIKDQVPYVWLDATHDIQLQASTIASLNTLFVPGPGQTEPPFPLSDRQLIDTVTQEVNKKGDDAKRRFVVFCDAVDTSDEQKFQRLEELLEGLLENAHIRVVLASKQKITFEYNWAMARKLYPYRVSALDDKSCRQYVQKRLNKEITDEMSHALFTLTHGYPLAIETAIELIHKDQIDPSHYEARRMIIETTVQKMLAGLLPRVNKEKKDWYRGCFSLLSMPRRFNLMLMKELFDEFAYKLVEDMKSPLEYLKLPKKIDYNNNILFWDLEKAGFTIESSIRHIFQLERELFHNDEYYATHTFLMERNKELALEVSGTDQVRYLREYLYHSVVSKKDSNPIQTFLDLVKEASAKKSPALELLNQFEEEYNQDHELREILKENLGQQKEKSILDQLRQRMKLEE